MVNLSEWIKRRARELGFDAVGITTADPPQHLSEFRRWLADGFHGEMHYLARRVADRADPTRLLAGARRVIVVARNYAPMPERVSQTDVSRPRSDYGRVARYALGPVDYHDAMGAQLEKLAALVEGKWYVDTGPVLERDFAQRAGLGWIGKHTNLISRQLGNWFFLGVVLTKLELPTDAPAREHCGRCTRCLAACPTGAIVAPYRLDARRCIAYLTIELKGSIPVELRPLIGDRIFGCEDCLEVCPWNRFARPVVRVRDWPPLTEMFSWDVRGTALERLGRSRLLRNLCVVLGNRGDQAALPVLERACQDADPLIREHAAWARARISVGPTPLRGYSVATTEETNET